MRPPDPAVTARPPEDPGPRLESGRPFLSTNVLPVGECSLGQAAEGPGCSSPDQGAVMAWGPGGPHGDRAQCTRPHARWVRPAGLWEDSCGGASSVRALGPRGQLGGPREASLPLAMHPWAPLCVSGPGPLCVTSPCPGRGPCWVRRTLPPLPLNLKRGGHRCTPWGSRWQVCH